jgi:hypothetical protein
MDKGTNNDLPYCSSVFSRAYILLLSLNSNTITLFCNRNVTSIGNKSRKRDTSSFQLLHSIRFVVITYQLTILCSDCPVVHHFKIQVNIGRKLVGLDTWVNCIFITPTLINYSIHGNDIRIECNSWKLLVSRFLLLLPILVTFLLQKSVIVLEFRLKSNI